MESFVAGFGGAGAGVPTKDPFDDSLPPTGNKDEEDAVSGFSLRRPDSIQLRRRGPIIKPNRKSNIYRTFKTIVGIIMI